uniref:RING-type domain-containing protein n=1 Tax=Sphenodon punctatus TaxID=8508 RepID=A0A8D0H285_SPHPU
MACAPGFSNLVEDLLCPICLDIFQNPQMLGCGHNFCLSCLEGCVMGQQKGTCPECRTPFTLHGLAPNRALANLAEKARRLKLDARPQEETVKGWNTLSPLEEGAMSKDYNEPSRQEHRTEVESNSEDLSEGLSNACEMFNQILGELWGAETEERTREENWAEMQWNLMSLTGETMSHSERIARFRAAFGGVTFLTGTQEEIER